MVVWCSAGIPARIVVVWMNQSSVEKKGWVPQSATNGRPVTARATLTAAVVASEPFLANFTISAPGTWARNVSAARSSQMLGREKLMPSAAASAAAATTGW